MSNFVEQMKNRVDTMTEDQIVYLLLPEMLHFKDEAEKEGDNSKIQDCHEILRYIKQRVELENFKVYDDFKNPKFKVPSPSDIINKKSPPDVPNN